MLRLADTYTVPQGGWKFLVRQTGTLVSGADYARCFNSAVAELDRAARPVPLDYEEQFQDEFCHQNLAARCEGRAAPASAETRQLKAGDIIRFLRVLREWCGVGGELASQSEAERRAEICVGCRYNVTVQGCSVCQGVAAKVMEIIGQRTTRLDAQLKGCAVCACENKAQVHVPLTVLQKGITSEMQFPDYCWKKP